MEFGQVLWNAVLLFGCYLYILVTIAVASRMENSFRISRRVSRKFLHIMIGNLPFIVPFFTLTFFPVLVAAPFILVTFLASPYSPFKGINKKMVGLAGMTEEGHRLGLIFYAVSYTFLALFFASKPYVLAAGILPMAYGDAAASLIGERHGRRKFKLVAEKSIEGSMAMFLVSFSVLTVGLLFFSVLYQLSFLNELAAALGAVIVATMVEGLSPLGFDNFTVPTFAALTFILLGGGW